MGFISNLKNSIQQTVGNNGQPAVDSVQAVEPAVEPVPAQTEIPVTPINDIGSGTYSPAVTDLSAGSGTYSPAGYGSGLSAGSGTDLSAGSGTDLSAGSGTDLSAGSGSEVIQHVITPEELTTQYLLGENDRLREIYKQLTNHDVQKTIQHTEHQQKKINSYMTINYVLFVLFYIACIVFAFMFFYMTKNETILGMSIYKKVGIFLLVITYPFWVSLLDQIVMFVLRYLYALALGVPYIKGIKQ
jgi:cytochrome c oxidase subunit IV